MTKGWTTKNIVHPKKIKKSPKSKKIKIKKSQKNNPQKYSTIPKKSTTLLVDHPSTLTIQSLLPWKLFSDEFTVISKEGQIDLENSDKTFFAYII